MRQVTTPANDDVNVETLCAIRGTVLFVYRRLAVAWAALLAVGANAALLGPIELVENSQEAWCAWAIVAAVSVAWTYGAQYSALLRGIGEVALQQRIGCLTSIGQLTTSLIVLGLGGGLLALALAYSSWFLVQILLTAKFAERNLARLIGSKGQAEFDPGVFATVWASTWRSAVGILMGFGLLQVSGIAYSQLAPAGQSAAYLLALRVLSSINQFGQAPFYAKLPQFARLRAANQLDVQRRRAQAAMRISYWVLVAGVLIIAVVADPALKLLGTNTKFVSDEFWLLLACGGLVERYGAMHLQLYSTTNHILWHWINGITGLIFAGGVVALYPVFMQYAFPISYCVSNIGFYGWFSARLSYTALGVSPWQFERLTLVAPLVTFVLGATLVLTLL